MKEEKSVVCSCVGNAGRPPHLSNRGSAGLKKTPASRVNRPIPVFLVIIHVDDGLPVGGDLHQVELLTDIDQIQDVFLETRAPEAHRSHQELWTDSGVAA